jgi:hypothetical protein
MPGVRPMNTSGTLAGDVTLCEASHATYNEIGKSCDDCRMPCPVKGYVWCPFLVGLSRVHRWCSTKLPLLRQC